MAARFREITSRDELEATFDAFIKLDLVSVYAEIRATPLINLRFANQSGDASLRNAPIDEGLGLVRIDGHDARESRGDVLSTNSRPDRVHASRSAG